MIKVRPDTQNQKVELSLGNLKQLTNRGIRQGFYFLGRDLMKTSQKGIKDPPKTGRIYKIRSARGRRKNHQASAAGEYPANLTGELRKGVRFEVQGNSRLVFGAQAEHGPYLELGTRKMAERPFLKKSVLSNQRNAKKHFVREIRRAHENENI